MFDRNRFLEVSPYEGDLGHKIGLDPRRISPSDLAVLGGPQSPVKAIRAYCHECSGGNDSEVRKCLAVKCPLWPFRMGSNVFHSRAVQK